MQFILKLFGVACIALFFAAGVYLFVTSLLPRMNESRKLTDQRNALEAEVAALKAEVDDFKSKQDRFATDAAFVERVARQNGRATPDEVVFVFE